jgi:hypothetical protein
MKLIGMALPEFPFSENYALYLSPYPYRVNRTSKIARFRGWGEDRAFEEERLIFHRRDVPPVAG